MICSTCPNPITRHSKTGRCRPCCARALAADPAILRKRGAAISHLHRNPEFKERHRAATIAAKAAWMQDPANRAAMSEKGRIHGAANIRHCHTPEAMLRKRAGLVPWCPVELLDLNASLRRQGVRQDDRKKMIADLVTVTAKRIVGGHSLAALHREERRRRDAY